MRANQIFAHAALLLWLGSFVSLGLAADNFRKLKDAEIKARLAGMEISDGVHWAEQYMRDGTYKAFHLGKPSKANGLRAMASCAWTRARENPTAGKYGSPVTRSNSAVLVSRVFCRPNRSAGECGTAKTMGT